MNKLLLGLGLFGAYVLLKSPEAVAQPVPVAPKPSAPPVPVKPAQPAPKPAAQAVIGHPNWDLPDSLLVGLPASLVVAIDAAYGAHDPISLSIYVPKLKAAGRADLASLVTADIQTMSRP